VELLVPKTRIPKSEVKPFCTVDGCDKPTTAKNMCKLHYKRFSTWGFTELRKRPVVHNKIQDHCNIYGCNNSHRARGFCNTHYKQEYAKILASSDIRRDGYQRSNGYVYSFFPSHPNASGQGYVPEHHLVMEEIIGRPLEKHENVHHKNGNRADNRPENLELWSTYQPKGQRIEDKVQYAIEILGLYAPDKLTSNATGA
jgi:hypothetical protein